MKRPFALIGFSILFSLVFAIAFHTAVLQLAVVFFAFSAVLFVFYFGGKKKLISAAVCCVSVCAALLGYSVTLEYYVKPIINTYDGEVVSFSGMIVTEPYQNGKNTHFTVKTTTINGERKSVKINVTASYYLPMEIYDKIEAKARLSSDFEEGYSYASYYGARNIFLTTYISTYNEGGYIVFKNQDKPFYAVFPKIREYISKTFREYLLNDEAGLCTAMITGDKQYLSDDVYQAFQRLGVSHILVVSGMHLSIAAAVIYFVTKSKYDENYISIAAECIGITFFAVLTGFGFSIRRALVMAILVNASRLFSSKPDILNSLGFAAFLLCLNPLNAGDIGLLWSFSCTLSIVLLANRMTDFLIEKLEVTKSFFMKLITFFSTAAAAMIGCVPFCIFVMGRVSPYTIIVNVLVVPFTGIIIVCGVIAVVMFALNIEPLGYLFIFFSDRTAKYMIYVTDLFDNLPYSSVNIRKSFVCIWFAVTVVIMILLIIFDKRKIYLELSVIASIAVFVGLFSCSVILDSGKVTLSVLDVGNGLTLTIKSDDHIVVLNSYGEEYQYNTIKKELSDFKSIDCLIDVPPKKTKYNYCERITNDFDVDKIIVADDKLYDEKYSHLSYIGKDVEKVSDKTQVCIYNGVTLEIIKTEKSTWEYLTVYDKQFLICPLQCNFNELPEKYENFDVVVLCDYPLHLTADKNTYVAVSAYGEECEEIMKWIAINGTASEITNGNGRIDFIISNDGSVDIKKVYTGGVTRYANNE